MATYVISDIHGEYGKFMELLDIIHFSDEDILYVLGDVVDRGKNPVKTLLKMMEMPNVIPIAGNHEQMMLECMSVLIKGNHDDVSDMRYKNVFEEIYDYKEITDYADQDAYKLVLSHYPILMWNGQHRGTIHLYGHTHNTYENEFYQECLRKLNMEMLMRSEKCYDISRAYNVGCMMPYMNYEPRTLKEILNK